MHRALTVTLLAVIALVAGAAVPVAAHPRAVALESPGTPASAIAVTAPALSESLTSAAPEPAAPWVAMAAAIVAALVLAWRPRRAVALTLVLVAAVLVFETGVHSAHHLGQGREAASCVVAGVTAQLNADLVDATPSVVPLRLHQTPITARADSAVTERAVAPDAGRAPPVLPV
jgi:hypothetical protein